MISGDMKCCSSCGLVRPIEEFALRHRGSGGRQSWCRACHAARDRVRYERLTPEVRADRRRRRRLREEATRRRIDQILVAGGCVDCGVRDPVVLEFDHIGPKSANVSDLVRYGASWQRIAREIAQCEIRCVNDHKRVTARRARRSAERTPNANGG